MTPKNPAELAIKALKAQNEWHRNIGVVTMEGTEVDLSDGYADSKLFEDTTAAINALEAAQPQGEVCLSKNGKNDEQNILSIKNEKQPTDEQRARALEIFDNSRDLSTYHQDMANFIFTIKDVDTIRAALQQPAAPELPVVEGLDEDDMAELAEALAMPYCEAAQYYELYAGSEENQHLYVKARNALQSVWNAARLYQQDKTAAVPVQDETVYELVLREIKGLRAKAALVDARNPGGRLSEISEDMRRQAFRIEQKILPRLPQPPKDAR